MTPLRFRRRRRLGFAAGVLAVATTVMLVFAGTGSAGRNDSAAGQRVKAGGTVTFAFPPSTAPNYIFPFMSLAYFSVYNVSNMQQLMYRPVYWFGKGSSPALNPSLSLASLPKYSKGNTVVSFTLKPYKWSNGETVTAQQVVFWMNILKVEKLGWAAYAPGGIPDDVKSVVATSPTKVTITLTGSTNPGWFTYNELSQITPFPMAWDISKTGQKAGSEACATAPYAKVIVKTDKKNSKVTPVSAAAKSCEAVYSYLSRQSGFDPKNPKAPNNSLKTYATNPLWQIVNGPWHLTKFESTGHTEMEPNPQYSGPVKPKIDRFVQLPFTSDEAEFNALVGGKLTVGYLPFTDVTDPAKSPTVPGKNNPRLSGFNIDSWIGWSINYFPYNFNSTGNGGQAGKIFRQLYFRQAFQLLINQPLYLEKIYKNYGVPTYGPVPVLPKNEFATKFASQNPYAYNPKKAIDLLTTNGWKVDPKGVTSCIDAAKCGVPAGTKLQFTLQYAAGSPTTKQLMEAEQAAWQQAGIKITLTSASFNTVIGNATVCSGKSCTWELQNWGGWVYAPDFYPSGELLFQTGAGSNSGSYSDKKNDALIHDTNFGDASLAQWQNYLVTQLPVVWQPTNTYGITEIRKDLKGVVPQNPLLSITPEN
ncbi:MAG: peptide/nickel transport system substrate-binding protein, partial [Gaiellales bacterium]|nr:peptide/nickel transport system substrate-binding protein [Gaiellales bacterium]